MARQTAPRGVLRDLGIVGWDRIEPVVLAAIATESPLLLIGPHGSAKTLVLTRLAAALGLAHRHYNASLLDFDDLVGFPVPDNGRLIYLQTPATIWDAESVLFDEVSRCRPEMQNKLFPIVHERIVQGVPLARLRHRWGAMNPPPVADGGQGGDEYAGAEPLDVALADRFAFIVRVPALSELSPSDQLSLLRHAVPAADAVGPGRLLSMVAEIQSSIPSRTAVLERRAAQYVQAVARKLAEAAHPISTRRAVQLTRNIAAVAAALQARPAPARQSGTGRESLDEDAFYTALRYSLPDEAWGAPVPHAVLLTVHRAAWQLAKLDDGDAAKAILVEPDPVRRIALALHAPLDAGTTGRIVVDAYASLERPARLVTAAVLAPLLSGRSDLPIATIEPIAGDFALLAASGTERITVRNGGADWRRDILSRQLPALDRSTLRGQCLANAAIVLLQADEPVQVQALEEAYDHAARQLLAAPGGGTRRP